MFGRKKPQPMPIPPAPPVIVPPVVEEKPAPQPAPESAQASAQAAEPAQTTKEADLTASISRNTVITGNIVSEDNLDIFGTVEGDVKSTAVVKVYGKITGDIDCATFVAQRSRATFWRRNLRFWAPTRLWTATSVPARSVSAEG